MFPRGLNKSQSQSESFSKSRHHKGKSSFREHAVSKHRHERTARKLPTEEISSPNTLTSSIVTIIVGRDQRLFAAHEEMEGGDGEERESTIHHHSVDGELLKDTVIYCAAEKYGLEELKRVALRKQGLQSGLHCCSTILSSARYAYTHTPDTDSKLRAHYLALIIRSRGTFKRSGTMQLEMMQGGSPLFFDLFVALANHMMMLLQRLHEASELTDWRTRDDEPLVESRLNPSELRSMPQYSPFTALLLKIVLPRQLHFPFTSPSSQAYERSLLTFPRRKTNAIDFDTTGVIPSLYLWLLNFLGPSSA
ncbi:hypothetical protein EYC84_004690 [Monilinia fructicola]|uniref:Uncharacterized protein n=1 Tax=Monilinia fructicola TaxID=38448 RepID=A0A5M9K522_MONFR|nr:hypothetical protein EYC84_004690 [Monilinia fructicola]